MLNSDELSGILFAIANGSREGARNIIESSKNVDSFTVAGLLGALDEVDSAGQARRLGDYLRSIEADRKLVNECYRTAFYLGSDWKHLSSNQLFAFFAANRAGRPIDKWVHYFPVFERHLARYRGLPCRGLEIGVYRGGGLEALSHFLGPTANLVGMDIDESAVLAVGDQFPIEIGDQEDIEFLRDVSEKHGPFDIIVDDGGHTMAQQITSVETLFPMLRAGGTYIVEDCHTSYWPAYGGAGSGQPTFVEWVKNRIDDIHAYHHSTVEVLPEPWQTALSGIHVYDSITVLEKDVRWAPFSEVAGSAEFINYGRDRVLADLEVRAGREGTSSPANGPHWKPGSHRRDATQQILATYRAAAPRQGCRNAPMRRLRSLAARSGGPLVVEATKSNIHVEGDDEFQAGDVVDRVAVIAHWAPVAAVGRSATELIRALIHNQYRVALVSSAEGSGPLVWTDRPAGVTVLRRPNFGYDFGSWACALARYPQIAEAPHVLLLNDSLAGPFEPVDHLLDKFHGSSADVWGLTDTTQYSHHLQSYCLGFLKGTLRESTLARFWRTIHVERSREDVIRRYEVGLGQLLAREHFVFEAAIPYWRVVKAGQNPTIIGWRALLDQGFPFVKRGLLRRPALAPDGSTIREELKRRFSIDVDEWD